MLRCHCALTLRAQTRRWRRRSSRAGTSTATSRPSSASSTSTASASSRLSGGRLDIRALFAAATSCCPTSGASASLRRRSRRPRPRSPAASRCAPPPPTTKTARPGPRPCLHGASAWSCALHSSRSLFRARSRSRRRWRSNLHGSRRISSGRGAAGCAAKVLAVKVLFVR